MKTVVFLVLLASSSAVSSSGRHAVQPQPASPLASSPLALLRVAQIRGGARSNTATQKFGPVIARGKKQATSVVVGVGGVVGKKQCCGIGRKQRVIVKTKPSGGTATIQSEVFNLVKAIVGVGVLSLPAGIANFGNSPSVLIPAVSLIAFIGVLSAFGFAVIGTVLCA